MPSEHQKGQCIAVWQHNLRYPLSQLIKYLKSVKKVLIGIYFPRRYRFGSNFWIPLKIRRVAWKAQSGPYWRWDPPPIDSIPIDPRKPGMLFDIVWASCGEGRPQSFFSVCIEKMRNKQPGVKINPLRECNVSEQNFFVNLKWVWIVERGKSHKHLINENSKGPPINLFWVALALDDFRC